jgi:tetratricopeptide (TPR) repeat protein
LQVPFIKLEHSQNRDTDRSQYLVGLFSEYANRPDNHRNLHYLGRELMYRGFYRTALTVLMKHITHRDSWPAEVAQSIIFKGDIYRAHKLQGNKRIFAEYVGAAAVDPTRRDGWMRAADMAYQLRNAPLAAAFVEAALTVTQPSTFYASEGRYYRSLPHEIAYWAYHQLGSIDKAREHWEKALALEPTNGLYLHDARFFMKLPKVSIIIPHMAGTRKQELEACLTATYENANYSDFSVCIASDSLEERLGCPKVFNRAVEECDGELIMFLGDDCLPQPNFLILAVLSHMKRFSLVNDGLTALNDGLWNGRLATHWIADRTFTERLPESVFLYEGYNHVGCDNELTAWAISYSRYNYCPEAVIIHKTPDDEVKKLGWDPEKVAADRALLKKRLPWGMPDPTTLDTWDACQKPNPLYVAV